MPLWLRRPQLLFRPDCPRLQRLPLHLHQRSAPCSLRIALRRKCDARVAEARAIPTPTTVDHVPFWQRLGALSGAIHVYSRAQSRRPYATQVYSAVVIYLAGDLVAQAIGKDDYDWRRTVRMLVIGTTAAIPGYKWFMFLARNFNHASSTLSLTVKVFVNQIVFTPVFNSYFFGLQSLLAGDRLEDAWDRIVKTVPTSFINACKVWPAITAVNFAYVQPQFRSVFAGVIAIFWQAYLSYLNRLAELDAFRRFEGVDSTAIAARAVAR